jgi:hypothetical protein
MGTVLVAIHYLMPWVAPIAILTLTVTYVLDQIGEAMDE